MKKIIIIGAIPSGGVCLDFPHYQYIKALSYILYFKSIGKGQFKIYELDYVTETFKEYSWNVEQQELPITKDGEQLKIPKGVIKYDPLCVQLGNCKSEEFNKLHQDPTETNFLSTYSNG